jgi:hypothetical protein
MSEVVLQKNLNFVVTITGMRHFYIHTHYLSHSVVPNTMYLKVLQHILILPQSSLYEHCLFTLTNLTTITNDNIFSMIPKNYN